MKGKRMLEGYKLSLDEKDDDEVKKREGDWKR